LPSEVAGDAAFHPYTPDHVIFQMQLLMGAMLAFNVLKKRGLYPPERRAQILDFDWTYRRFGLGLLSWGNEMWTRLGAQITYVFKRFFGAAGRRLYYLFSPASAMSQDAPSGLAAVLTAAMLTAALFVVYFI